mmetsp:Transcript_1184/g.4933  ORF Transcript_1184/g.4933 Transcript_1184/m.4933 type:complete len:231 (+) Transcript_1184:196-888(+)
MLLSSVSTAVPVAGSLFKPPGRTITYAIPVFALTAFKCSSAFAFSINTGFNASNTFGGGASALSPVPMLVTSTNFPTPFAAAASISAMFASLSARGSAGVPPIVLTTASYSSLWFIAFSTSFAFSASPFTRNPPTDSISLRFVSCLCSTVAHVPFSVSCRNTSMATPFPPHTKTEMLSGSRSPARATIARREVWIAIGALRADFIARARAATATTLETATVDIVSAVRER